MPFEYAEIGQEAGWPGVVAIEACEYTCNHGITPNRAVVVVVPQPDGADRPVSFGDLTFGDGSNRVRLKNCKLDRWTGERGPRGLTWTLELLDRRWLWKSPGDIAFGFIPGQYNRMDTHGKLVPWTIRSPKELAELCLEALGEKGYKIAGLPEGLSRKDGEDLNGYLKLGDNLPVTLANPTQVWGFATPPAEALARLVEYFGCRVVFQPNADRVSIEEIGKGGDMPDDWPYEYETPSLDLPEMPRSVAVVSAPVRIQSRWLLEPVGEDWHGGYVPIDQLSYIPAATESKAHVVTLEALTAPSPAVLFFSFLWTRPDGTAKRIDENAAGTVAEMIAAIRTKLEADPDYMTDFRITAAPGVLVWTSQKAGQYFDVRATGTDGVDPPNRWKVTVNQEASSQSSGFWKKCPPPSFTNVLATDRLSYTEALSLAKKTVFKAFRILLIDPETRQSPYKLPWFGEVKRRQQMRLQLRKVAQVEPAGRLGVGPDGPIDRSAAAIPGSGVLPEFYNGYSRDQKATAHGSVFKLKQAVNWVAPAGKDPNSEPFDRVFIDVVSVDEEQQVVFFADYVYKATLGGWLEYPDITLEALCLVEDFETGELTRHKFETKLDGIAPTQWQIQDDVIVDILPTYEDQSNKLGSFVKAGIEQAEKMAGHYLDGMAKRYRLTGGKTRKLVGIWPGDPTGLIQQITWTVGDEASTVVSTNTEHSPFVPPHPARRMAESLPPNKAAMVANAAERAVVEKWKSEPLKT